MVAAYRMGRIELEKTKKEAAMKQAPPLLIFIRIMSE